MLSLKWICLRLTGGSGWRWNLSWKMGDDTLARHVACHICHISKARQMICSLSHYTLDWELTKFAAKQTAYLLHPSVLSCFKLKEELHKVKLPLTFLSTSLRMCPFCLSKTLLKSTMDKTDWVFAFCTNTHTLIGWLTTKLLLYLNL